MASPSRKERGPGRPRKTKTFGHDATREELRVRQNQIWIPSAAVQLLKLGQVQNELDSPSEAAYTLICWAEAAGCDYPFRLTKTLRPNPNASRERTFITLPLQGFKVLRKIGIKHQQEVWEVLSVLIAAGFTAEGEYTFKPVVPRKPVRSSRGEVLQ